jgi:hypothetical protein
MPALVVTKCVGDLDVGDVGSARLQPSLGDGIHTDSAYPALKRRANVKRPADDVGPRNDMRTRLIEFLFRCKETDDKAKNQRDRCRLARWLIFEKDSWMGSRHATSSRKMFHDERPCESDRENHQEILDSRRYLDSRGGGLDTFQPNIPRHV